VRRKTRKPDTVPMYPISLLNQAIHRRWMLFVDGENLTLRAQEFARQQNIALKSGRHYLSDTFHLASKLEWTTFDDSGNGAYQY
jgi:hypothetical protein